MLRSGMPSGEERRGLTLQAAHVEVRDAGEGAQRFFGHAAVFDTRTAIGNPASWGFYEEIAPGAFTKTLSEGDARMLIDHNPYYVVSRSSAGTLELAQDSTGLRVDSTLDTSLSYVSDLIANLRNGNITGMSFGFRVIKDDWSEEEVEVANAQDPITVDVRVIREVKLIEVSAVTFPAYEETDAGLRHSLVPALRHRGDPEAIARAAKSRPELAELLGYIPDSEPVEPTRADGDEHEETITEPAASTRLAPSQHDLAKSRLTVLRTRLRHVA